jgi:alpha/beta superfamily hydrolase
MEQQIVIPVGNERIYGMLHLPEDFKSKKPSIVVICHGFISNKIGQHRIFVKTARKICQAGLAVLRFDYTGCGESSGDHQDITFDNQVKETAKVLDFLTSYPNIATDNIILLGHSFGGCVASAVASSDKRVKSLILWSPVANPLEDIVGIVGKAIYQQSLAGNLVHYQGFELGRGFFISLLQNYPLETIKTFTGNVLLIHGAADVETPLINAGLYGGHLSERSLGQHEIKVIEDADHTYSRPVWEEEVIAVTLRWLKKQYP